MQGTPAASHASDRGLTTSGVESRALAQAIAVDQRLANWRRVPERIANPYRSFQPCTFSAGCQSLGQCLACHADYIGVAFPNEPSGPVRGLTKPTLITSLACAKADVIPLLLARTIPPAPAATCLTKPRRETPAMASRAFNQYAFAWHFSPLNQRCCCSGT